MLLIFRCLCDNCTPQPSEGECLCCAEVGKIAEVWGEGHIGCITTHPGFDPVCLNPHTLDVAYLAYKQQYGNAHRQDSAR